MTARAARRSFSRGASRAVHLPRFQVLSIHESDSEAPPLALSDSGTCSLIRCPTRAISVVGGDSLSRCFLSN